MHHHRAKGGPKKRVDFGCPGYISQGHLKNASKYRLPMAFLPMNWVSRHPPSSLPPSIRTSLFPCLLQSFHFGDSLLPRVLMHVHDDVAKAKHDDYHLSIPFRPDLFGGPSASARRIIVLFYLFMITAAPIGVGESDDSPHHSF